MNVILILPPPLLCLSSHHCHDSNVLFFFSPLGPGPAELSDQGLILALSVDVKSVRSICAWHLPNGDGLSGSPLCLSVSNWHTYSVSRHMQVVPSLPTSGPPRGPFKQWSCGGSLLVYILWAISCTPSQTLSARIKHNWPSGAEA